MTNDLQLLGVDYRFAPIEVREELSFSPAEAAELLRSLFAVTSGGSPGRGGAVVSTCNRTEFYVTGPAETGQSLLTALRSLRPHARALHEQCYRYSESGPAAALHLFRVAGGLESQIPGDIHILSQVRRAIDTARTAGAANALLELTFRSATRAARRIRRETGFCQGAASVGGAVARTLTARFPASPARILVLGAGQAGVDIAAHLAKKRLGPLRFASRRPEQAARMCAEFGGAAVAWDQLDSLLSDCGPQGVDAVVAATSGRPGCLETPRLENARRSAGNAPLVIVDAGVPRNVDSSVRLLPGVDLLDLDMLEREQQSVIEARLAHQPAAVAILTAELERWQRESARLAVEPAIKGLYQASESIRLRLIAETRCGDDIDRVTAKLMKRLLDGPVRRLRRHLRGELAAAPPRPSPQLLDWILSGPPTQSSPESRGCRTQ
ncbi:MAG: hypothetical protein U0Q16_18835 [Bryobacteraceae bacterium]